LNVPANLSDTGKRRRLFFATERQASAEAERLKTRAHNFRASLGNLTSSQIIEAADCYELLAPFSEARLKDAVLHYREALKARTKSVNYLELFNRYLAFKQNCSQKYLKELRITRDRFPSLIHCWSAISQPTLALALRSSSAPACSATTARTRYEY
jgi:hypothetical protein